MLSMGGRRGECLATKVLPPLPALPHQRQTLLSPPCRLEASLPPPNPPSCSMEAVRGSLREDALKRAVVRAVAPQHLMSEPACLQRFDLATMRAADQDFTAPFKLTVGAGGLPCGYGGAQGLAAGMSAAAVSSWPSSFVSGLILTCLSYALPCLHPLHLCFAQAPRSATRWCCGLTPCSASGSARSTRWSCPPAPTPPSRTGCRPCSC